MIIILHIRMIQRPFRHFQNQIFSDNILVFHWRHLNCLVVHLPQFFWFSFRLNKQGHFLVLDQYEWFYKFYLKNPTQWGLAWLVTELYSKIILCNLSFWELPVDWLPGFHRPCKNGFHRVLYRGSNSVNSVHGNHLY